MGDAVAPAVRLDPWVRALVHRVDAALTRCDTAWVLEQVRGALVDAMTVTLPRFLLRARRYLPDRPTRRLVHADLAARFEIVVVTWGPGHRSALHSHDGRWVVCAVLEGCVVESVPRDVREAGPGVVRLGAIASQVLRPGGVVAQQPPADVHRIENRSATDAAVTLHVFGGRLRQLPAFEQRAHADWAPRLVRLEYDPW